MLQDSHLVDSWTILLVICVGASPPRHPPRTRRHPELAPELARPRQAGSILQSRKDVIYATFYVPEAHDLLTNPPSHGISNLDGEMNTVCFLSCNSPQVAANANPRSDLPGTVPHFFVLRFTLLNPQPC